MFQIQVRKDRESDDVQVTLCDTAVSDQSMRVAEEEDANALLMALRHLPRGTFSKLLQGMLAEQTRRYPIRF